MYQAVYHSTIVLLPINKSKKVKEFSYISTLKTTTRMNIFIFGFLLVMAAFAQTAPSGKSSDFFYQELKNNVDLTNLYCSTNNHSILNVTVNEKNPVTTI